MISKRLIPHCSRIVGADIAENAVEAYNEKFAKEGYTDQQIHAVPLDLKGAEDELGGEKFDVIMVRASSVYVSSLSSTTLILA